MSRPKSRLNVARTLAIDERSSSGMRMSSAMVVGRAAAILSTSAAIR
jgi:hypothetical protein